MSGIATTVALHAELARVPVVSTHRCPSWPDPRIKSEAMLVRPSTTCFVRTKDVDGRDKRGHDAGSASNSPGTVH